MQQRIRRLAHKCAGNAPHGPFHGERAPRNAIGGAQTVARLELRNRLQLPNYPAICARSHQHNIMHYHTLVMHRLCAVENL